MATFKPYIFFLLIFGEIFCFSSSELVAQSRPLINNLVPNSAYPGDTLTLNGQNFPALLSQVQVFIGGRMAQVIATMSNSLQVIVPGGAINGEIQVIHTGTGLQGDYQNFTPLLLCGESLSLSNFDPAVTTNYSHGTADIFSLDLDGDELPELITSLSGGTPGLQVYANQGMAGILTDSTLAPTVNETTLQVPRRIKAADFSGNGERKLVVMQDSVVSLIEYPFGGPQVHLSNSPNAGYADMLITDWNADGRPDLMLVDSINGNLIIFENQSPNPSQAPLFSAALSLSLPQSLSQMMSGDLDTDGKPDLCLSRPGWDSVYVILNNSNGGPVNMASFTSVQAFYTANLTGKPSIGDLNGDFLVDLMFPVNPASGPELLLWQNNSTSSNLVFIPSGLSVGTLVQYMDLADLNGDGKADIIAAPVTLNQVVFYENQSTSSSLSWGGAINYGLPGQADQFIIEDFDGDDLLDLVFQANGNPSLMRNANRPLLAFQHVPDDICVLDTLVSLAPTPSGGLLSGLGTHSANYTFNPIDIAPVTVSQQVPFTYVYTNSLGCTRFISDTILVKATPDVSFMIKDTSSGMPVDSIFCFSDLGAYELEVSSSSWFGSFSGNGVNGIAFSVDNIPASLKDSEDTTYHIIRYEEPSPITGCIGFFEQEIAVLPNPNVLNIFSNLPDDNEICLGDNTIFSLSCFSPAWAAASFFSGSGVVPILGSDSTASFSLQYLDPDTLPFNAILPITFTIIDSFGCIGDRPRAVQVIPSPTLGLEVDMDEACEGELVSFKAIVLDTTLFPNIGLSNWTWEFPGIDTLQGVEIGLLFNQAGQFPFQYAAITDSDCRLLVQDTILILERPNAEFAIYDECERTTVSITDNSNGSIDSWLWDNGIGDTFSVQNPGWSYDTTGTFTISLIASNGICRDTFSQEIRIFPYLRITGDRYSENFDSGPGLWVPEGNPSSWEWGVAQGPSISTDPGNGVWKTGLDSPYIAVENSHLLGPCLDISGLSNPMLMLDKWADMQPDLDGAVIQVRKRGRQSWQNLGSYTQGENPGLNWYNSFNLSASPGHSTTGWTNQDSIWTSVRHSLDHYLPDSVIQLRISFASSVVNPDRDGMGIDNIFIGNRSQVQLLEHFINQNASGYFTDNQQLNSLFYPRRQELFLLQYHTKFPHPDSANLANSADPNARTLYYNMSSPQAVVLQGEFVPGGLANLDTNVVERNSLANAQFRINLNVEDQPNGDWEISGNLNALDSIALQELILMVGIAQRSRKNNSNGAVFFHELLEFVPHAGGTYFQKSWIMGESENFQFSWNPGNNNPDSLVIFAFVQNLNSKEVYQTIARPKEYILTDLEEEMASTTITIFPNPSRGILTLQLSQAQAKPIALSISDIQGRAIFQSTIPARKNEWTMNLNDLPKGIYFIVLHSVPNFHYMAKFVIE